MTDLHREVYGYTEDIEVNQLLNKLTTEERRQILEYDEEKLKEEIARLSSLETEKNTTEPLRLEVYKLLLGRRNYSDPREVS